MSKLALEVDYTSLDGFKDGLAACPCPHCGYRGLRFEGPAEGPHFAVLLCSNPDPFLNNGKIGFLRFPGTPASRRRARPIKRLDEDRCHVCLATRTETEMLGRTLEAHHLIDRAGLVEAGVDPDDLKYLAWVCSTPCHAIITALRHAFGRQITLLYAAAAIEEAADELDPRP
jgi:hypothetical protein